MKCISYLHCMHAIIVLIMLILIILQSIYAILITIRIEMMNVNSANGALDNILLNYIQHIHIYNQINVIFNE